MQVRYDVPQVTSGVAVPTMLMCAPVEDLCLNFANTLSWRGSQSSAETLCDLADLLGWLAKSAGVGTAVTGPIADWSRTHPKTAAELFAEAIALREVIYRVFRALAQRDSVRDQDFAALNRALMQTATRHRLASLDGGYVWQVETGRIDRAGPTVPALLAPVLWSAGDLMIKHANVRQCANEKCLWLFLDKSKNGSRRWCEMKSCGNRAKARRHYLRVTAR
jgi:predicted RNA-binding Zn ribbon-like protein